MSAYFWEMFNGTFKEKLGVRAFTTQKTFEYLDTLKRPVTILETGCLRSDSWGDGQSTWLFDTYAYDNPGSKVFSVDKDVVAVATASKRVSGCTTVTVSDSIAYLSSFVGSPDLVYLDSFDLDLKWPLPSAIHHLMELTAILPKFNKDTLVVVDDALMQEHRYEDNENNFVIRSASWIGGKARFVAEYAEAVGVKPFFVGYQCGWLNLARKV